MTPYDLAAIRARHVESERTTHPDGTVSSWCLYCDDTWPCGTALVLAEVDRLREALEDMTEQFGYWTEGEGGIWTGGLSALEGAFDALGWKEPHPLPHRVCDEPGCSREGTIGTPRVVGLTGGEYRRTCRDHVPEGWPER